MPTETNTSVPAIEQGNQPSSSLRRSDGWLTRPRVLIGAVLAFVLAGLAMNWPWLTAIGVAPILLSLAPCAVMCALGLCMRGSSCNRK